MGFPMTAERVIERNRLRESGAMLLDDIRRLEKDSATLAVRAERARLRGLFSDPGNGCSWLTFCRSSAMHLPSEAEKLLRGEVVSFVARAAR